ncbi:hypothetical protein PIB30_006534 [Stylosanthes scabra]|uniref:Inositol polyphosphate-related phosphatase domain-containing protein n=1 Tax=Stylosanthes scabra TaxID=79078 RepID=A0ABU6X5Y9_9FABA|nr:hypothetical protein [Stylosanthes scabra]
MHSSHHHAWIQSPIRSSSSSSSLASSKSLLLIFSSSSLAMDNKMPSSSYYRRLRSWFNMKKEEDHDHNHNNGTNNNDQPSFSLYEIQDEGEDEIDGDYGGGGGEDLTPRSLEFDPCILTNKLRSPIGSLAVDLEDWLNLKDAADVYVLGFQEIVPLKTLNVIGAEDQAVATRWNNLIAKTLNKTCELCSSCPNSTPFSISSCDNYYCYRNNNNNNNNLSRDNSNKRCCRDSRGNNHRNEYTLVASKKMVGVFISVWINKEVLRKWHVSNVRVCSVACGVMGYLGNKGSVAVSMSIEGTSFCFVAAHLASGEKKGDQGRRNHQVAEIFRRTCFSRTAAKDYDINHHHPLTILGHDRIFWFGDLNYRLYLEDNLARNLIRKQDWKGLHEFDQLQKELEEGGVFEGWREGNIQFAPTYKYSSSISNRYCGGSDGGGIQSKLGEKQRTPAWCDRILWYGKGIEQLHYIRSEIKFSDHRPVSALFTTHVEIDSSASTLLKLHKIQPTFLHPTNHDVKEEDKDGNPTLLSLLTKDIQGY